MLNQSDIEKLERFGKGLSDADEEKYVYSLFSENEGNRKFKQHILKEFNEYFDNNSMEDHNLSYLLDRIIHTIHKNENKKRLTVVKKIYWWYSAAAAVLFIPLLIAGGIWFALQNQQEVIVKEAPVTYTLFAPLGSRVSFALPDGTKGWLNSGSSLEYNSPFSNNRGVNLLGEAYFDVALDANHPFEIIVDKSKIKVLGTKFNLNAYPDENYLEVVLEEGKVECSLPGLSSGIEMKPNERLVFSDGVVNIGVTDAAKYSAWKDGKLMFKSDSMAEVARRIQRWYNVDVILVDEELKNHVIRGTFQDNSLEEVFRYLSLTSPIRYQIVDSELLDDGIIQKKKVLLYRKNTYKSN